jgi:biopolymer transport protein ExbB
MIQIPLFAQVTESGNAGGVTTAAKAAAAGTKDVTLWEMIASGGWYIMIPMAVLSILLVYIAIERFMAIQKAVRGESTFMKQVREYIVDGKLDAARNLCATTDNPYARMVEKGISKIGRPLKDIEASVENVAKIEIFRLEKGVSLLATIAGAAPMIGFLGTVIGMIITFNEMRVSPSIKIEALSGGIMMAMVTTVVGLIIGIIAYIMYNTLVSKVQTVISKMETTSIEFLDLLDEPGK